MAGQWSYRSSARNALEDLGIDLTVNAAPDDANQFFTPQGVGHFYDDLRNPSSSEYRRRVNEIEKLPNMTP